MAHITPGQNYDHLLTPISGYNGMHDLQFQGNGDSAANWNRGSLLGLDADGELIPFEDLAGTLGGHAMALFAINASYDLDVTGGGAWGAGANSLFRVDAGNIAGQTLASDNSTVLTKKVGTLVATGGFELVTTEFNTGSTYNENDPLIGYTTVGGEPTDSYPEGWLDVGTIQAGGELALEENIVGVVSTGARTETYGQDVLQFWPVYLPARAVTP